MSDICVCSHHESVAQLLADAEFRGLAHRAGFLIELRLDHYSDLSAESLDRALDAFAPEVVVTFRHAYEGGHNAKAPDDERLGFLQRAAERGVRYVDIEARTNRGNFRKNGAQIILSYHDFQKAPGADELRRIWRMLVTDSSADVIKIACAPKTIFDTVPLLDLLVKIRDEKKQAVILGMGEAGFWTRVAGPLFGAPFAFARSESAGGTAPGQPTWQVLDELYRFRAIKPGWPVYGVIGDPIAHSLSPLMQNVGLKALGCDGIYLPFRVEGDPAEFVRAFAPLGLRGLSVTIPHKEAIRAVCAELDAGAAEIGAVNTLSRWPVATAVWRGSNTDALAAADCLENAAGALLGKRVLVLGAGGAARAVAFGVRARGAEIFIFNRSRQRAETLARECGAQAVTADDLPALKIDAIVNTTPLGMFPRVETTPLEAEQIPAGSVVFDTVYNPLRTKLLKLAAARGCRVVEGAAMFVAQGARQLELWTGRPAPREALEAAVLEALRQR